jgi:predicted N-formylglutamate amidohydrolase
LRDLRTGGVPGNWPVDENQKVRGGRVSQGPGKHAVLLLTCEHGGNRIPAAYASLFRGAEELLASHRGWDPGALTLAQFMARRLGRPLLAVTWTRLLVESNRAPSNPRIWSRFTKALPREERQRILDRWWWPHRQAVERAVASTVARGDGVVHVAVHSFTPVLDGEVRNAETARGGFLSALGCGAPPARSRTAVAL